MLSLCTSNRLVIEYGVLPGKGGVTLSYPELRKVPGERESAESCHLEE